MRQILFVALFLANVTIAQADWQYTKWGMTQDQIIEASGHSAVLSGHDLEAPYEAAGLKFVARFGFDKVDHTLNRVTLTLTGERGKATSLLLALGRKYGKPGKETGSMVDSDSHTQGIQSYNCSQEWWTEADHVTFRYWEYGLDPFMAAAAAKMGRAVPPRTFQTAVVYEALRSKENDGL